MDCARIGPEGASETASFTSVVRRAVVVCTRLAIVVAAVAMLNVGVAYAGEDCGNESPPSSTESSDPGDANNNGGYSGGAGPNWSYQDQDDHSADVKLTVGN